MKAAESEGSSPTQGLGLGGFALGLKLFWLACFATIGGVFMARALDAPVRIAVSGVGLKTSGGPWDPAAVEVVCRQALAQHGEDPASALQLDYRSGERLGLDERRPGHLRTAWAVPGRAARVEVWVDLEGDEALCTVLTGPAPPETP